MLTTTDLILLTAAVGALFSAGCTVLAVCADWPREARHRTDRPRPGADVPTPPAPWRTTPAVLPDTRPLQRGETPDLLVDSPPSTRGRIPAPGLPVVRKPSCTLCDDGVHVLGPVCIWCGCRPVMQP